MNINVYAIFERQYRYLMAIPQSNIGIKRTLKNRGHHKETTLQVSPRASTVFFCLALRIFKLSLDRIKGGRYVDTYHLSGYTPRMLARTERNRNGKTCSGAFEIPSTIHACTCEFPPQTFYGVTRVAKQPREIQTGFRIP